MTNRIDRVGKFEIIERLGEGGMGEVFLARDTIIGREVALKIFRRASLAPPDPEARFLRESQAVSRLNHPNLVTIHEFGDKGGALYQAMDYVAGEDLTVLFRDRALAPKEALELLAQVCDGLAHAHQHGILHRDLKPANVRMGRVAGRPAPKILDLGMTRLPGHDAAQLATLACSAPEALQGKAEARSDLFSAGCLLYEALTGSSPFAADSPAAIAQRVREEQPAPLDLGLFPELSPAIQDILAQALAKDPADRFASAEAMAEAFRAARNPAWSPQHPAETLTSARLIPVPKPTPARSRAPLAWSFVLALVVLGGAGGYWQRSRRRKPPAPAPAPIAPIVTAPQSAPLPPPPPVPETPPPAPKGPATLDEAAGALEKDPLGALAFLDQAVGAQGAEERAYALRIVALYNLGRYGESGKAIRDAREAGHSLWPMALKNPPLRAMLERNARDPHLPKRKAPEAPAEP